MCELQHVTGHPHVPPVVFHVTRTWCVMTFTSLCETQTHRFGILCVSSHNGRLRTTQGLPPGSDFITRDFEGPTGHNTNNPFETTHRHQRQYCHMECTVVTTLCTTCRTNTNSPRQITWFSQPHVSWAPDRGSYKQAHGERSRHDLCVISHSIQRRMTQTL